MSLSLLAPMFLAGLGLMLIPWLIHRIQRPERRPVKFSSLMFIPRMDKEVVQRKRLQHLLLLLMRMAVLGLLAFAFSRPFQLRQDTTLASGAMETMHVILVDRSFSMGAESWMEDARSSAVKTIRSIPAEEPVALMTFDEAAEILVPFTDPDGGDEGREFVTRQVDRIKVSQRGTSYRTALLEAQRLLESGGVDGHSRRGVIHLIGDLQESGFDTQSSASWRVAPAVDVQPIAVGREDAPNRAVVDVVVRPIGAGSFRILGKIRNWTMDSDARFPVTLHVDGEPRETQELVVLKHHASQVSFSLEEQDDSRIEGWIEIAEDSLELDNRRYFAWNPPPRRTIAIIARNQGAEAWPSGWFARTAIHGAEDERYELLSPGVEDATSRMNSPLNRPDLVIVGELDGSDAKFNRAILDYLEAGGQALLTLQPGADAAKLNTTLLNPLGLRARQGGGSAGHASSYRLMSWIDFEHPIFRAFQAPQYNDFSTIRVFESTDLEIAKTLSSIRTLIRLEDGSEEGAPALVEASYGEGRALVWSFAHDPRVTNLPKSARYAPILLESVKYLVGGETVRKEFQVGEEVVLNPGAAAPKLRNRDDSISTVLAAGPGESVFLESAGLLELVGPGATAKRTVPVNPDAGESNPVRLSPESFRSRVLAPESRIAQEEEVAGPAGVAQPPLESGREIGVIFLIAVAGLLFVELWYAPRLVR